MSQEKRRKAEWPRRIGQKRGREKDLKIPSQTPRGIERGTSKTTGKRGRSGGFQMFAVEFGLQISAESAPNPAASAIPPGLVACIHTLQMLSLLCLAI